MIARIRAESEREYERIGTLCKIGYLTGMGTKVLSTRLSEEVLDELDRAVDRLGVTKRAFLESAIRDRARLDDDARFKAMLEATRGAWNRLDETPEETIENLHRASRERRTRRQARFAEQGADTSLPK